MSEDALKKLLDELHKNGVYAEVGEVSKQKHEGLKIVFKTDIRLDFSEHDKVFEEKIVKLEEQIAEMRKLCVKNDIYEMEKAQLCLLRDENKELKKRIDDLESEETKKPKNGWICVVAKEINGQEYVKLEDFLRVVNDLQEQNRPEDDGK